MLFNFFDYCEGFIKAPTTGGTNPIDTAIQQSSITADTSTIVNPDGSGNKPVQPNADGSDKFVPLVQEDADVNFDLASQLNDLQDDKDFGNPVPQDAWKGDEVGEWFKKGGGVGSEWTVNFTSKNYDRWKAEYVKAKSKSEAIDKAFRLISEDGEDSDEWQVESVYKTHSKGGGVGKYADGGKIEKLKTHIHDLYSKRSKWIGSSEAKANQKSPYDAEINKLNDELKKEIDNETETYNFFSISDYSGKSTEEKAAKMFYSFSEKNPYASLSKFIKSLKTPAQKKAFRKLQFPTYQKKWGIKMIANKTKDSIRFKKIFSDGGGVAEGWTDDELSDSEAQYAGGGKLKQTGTSDKAHDKVYKAKRVGYRYRDDFAKKHGLSPNAKPTEEHIEKYLHKGVYFEDRADRSDKSRMKKI